MTRRTRRSIAGSVLVVLGLVIGAVIVTALQAEGREQSRANTNDGGAWLLKRDGGYVGHVNKVVGEVTAAVSVADPGSDYDVDQADGIIVVHDRTRAPSPSSTTASSGSPTRPGMQVDADTTVHAVDGGALIVDRSSMTVWKLDRATLVSASSTDEIEPIISGEGATLSAATPGRPRRVRRRGRRPGRVPRPGRVDRREPGAGPHRLGRVDHVPRRRHGRARRSRRRRVRRHARTAPRRSTSRSPPPTAPPTPLILQQPGVAVRPRRRRHPRRPPRLPAAGRRRGGRDRPAPGHGAGGADRLRRLRVRRVDGPGQLRPVVPDGDGGYAEIQTLPLDGAGSELRLRLVNGWVWVNDVDSGAAWVTSPQQRLDRVEDWGNILSQLNDDSDDDNSDERRRRGPHRDQPRRPERRDRAVRRDRRGRPQPPADRPRRRDPDPRRPPDRRRRAGQRHRPQRRRPHRHRRRADGRRRRHRHQPRRARRPGRAGRRVRRAGHVHLHDHRRSRRERRRRPCPSPSRRRAASDNRPPEAHNDIASTRRGRPTTFDVLANDVDPDGDALVLEQHRPRRAGDQRRRARARPVRPGRVHARPQQHVRAHRADVHRQRRLRRHRRGHGDRVGAPAGRQQRARRPQRRRRHRGRQAGAAQRAGQRHRPRQRPAVHRPAADAGPAGRPVGRRPRPVPDPRRRAVLQPDGAPARTSSTTRPPTARRPTSPRSASRSASRSRTARRSPCATTS